MSLAPLQRSPLELVQAQLTAYNARDLTAFLDCYADDVRLYTYPSSLMCEGRAAMQERYAARFTDPVLFAWVPQRHVMGDCVIDHEQVRVTFPQGRGVFDLIAIYTIAEGKISEVRFIYGSRTPGASLPEEAGAPPLPENLPAS